MQPHREQYALRSYPNFNVTRKRPTPLTQLNSAATCPPDVGLDQYEFSSDFTTGDNASWVGADYTVIGYGDDGAEFTINKDTDAPTMHTEFYTFFGYYEVEMKAAPGTGVVSSIVLESDDLDEVDWVSSPDHHHSAPTSQFRHAPGVWTLKLI